MWGKGWRDQATKRIREWGGRQRQGDKESGARGHTEREAGTAERKRQGRDMCQGEQAQAQGGKR